MAPTFTYPTNAELQEVEQEVLPRLMQNRPIFEILPPEDVEADLIMWEQEDNYIGLQQVRGLGGQPGRVKKTGGKRYTVEPGYYGEYEPVEERELTTRRRWGQFGAPIDISDLITPLQNKLLQRRLDRMEYIGWTLLCTGTFSVSSATGGVIHTDSFTLQSYTTPVAYQASTIATATPLQDHRDMQIKQRGHGVRFDSTCKIYYNQVTVNAILDNTNANDLGGKRGDMGASILDLAAVNRIFLANNLPQIVPMDDGYFDDSGTFTLFIPNNQGVLVGKRISGTPIGSYAMTRNANNPDASPGAYTRVIDHGDMQIPRLIEVHDGHNGGPKLPFPSAIVKITC